MRPLLIPMLALVLLDGSIRAQPAAPASVRMETVALTDTTRARQVPVVFYSAATSGTRARLAILSHGYGGRHTDYGFIAQFLAAHGYLVASVQHEVPGDAPLPTTGRPYDVRMPSWQQGVRNILFVIDHVARTRPDVDASRVLLVGHSHGGDTSVLLARDRPSQVLAVITLDNRRMPFPRTATPKVLTLRSSDQPADEGVLPTPEEQATLGMTVVRLPATIHNDMWDGATAAQKAEMLGHIERFLRGLS